MQRKSMSRHYCTIICVLLSTKDDVRGEERDSLLCPDFVGWETSVVSFVLLFVVWFCVIYWLSSKTHTYNYTYYLWFILLNCQPNNSTSVSFRLKHRWEDICSFRVFPYKFQTSLQLFELVDDYIQQEIRKPPQQATCSVRFYKIDGFNF